MRSILFFIIAFAMVLLAPSCTVEPGKPPPSSLFDLKKLSGRWEFLNNDTHQIEEWLMINDKELKGRGFVLEEGDTTFIEFLSIKEKDGVLTYFAQVSDIGVAEVIPFSLSAQSADRIEFSNYTQDFPKKIGYELKNDSSMLAYIEGPRDGNNIRITFDFQKKTD